MNVSSSTSGASLLNYINNSSDDKNDNSIISVLQKNREAQTTRLQQILSKYSKESSDSTSDYEKLISSAESVEASITTLTSTSEGNLFDSAVASGNSSQISVTISSFTSSYNSMVSSMNSLGGTVYSYYASSITATFTGSKEQLEEIGITMNEDGTLQLDSDKLGTAVTDKVKSVFGSDSEYMSNLLDTIKDMVSTVSQALSIKESLQSSYGSTGLSNMYSSLLSGSSNSYFA